ncbi:MAG: FAD-dependent oxidoreductase [Labrenzia sp.]
MEKHDLVVIGAGPAGLSAATLAAKHGARVALLDEQTSTGGQIYRNVTEASGELKRILGLDYAHGSELASAFFSEKIAYTPSATVWDISADQEIAYSVAGRAQQIKTKCILLATGALERPVPVKGWLLPGVMTAGAAQILLKSSGLVSDRAVLVGSGPLLYLLASQMITAGSPPLAIVETQTLSSYLKAVCHIWGAARGYKAILKGLGLQRVIRKAGVKRYVGANAIEILGASNTTGLQFQVSGKSIRINCDTVFLHQGVVPNTQLSRALGLDHEWNIAQRCFRPVCDRWGRSSLGSVFVSGDGAGIGGAKAAELTGSLVALEVLRELGQIKESERDRFARPVAKALRRELAVRPFLDALYPVPQEIACPANDVQICRCEEVSAGEIRDYARLGCLGPNQTKAFGRSGMGPCQGRYCGLTVTEILAKEHSLSPDQVGSYRIRMPIKPVTLGELAALNTSN